MKELLLSEEQGSVKEKAVTLTFDDDGFASDTVEINGTLEFIQLKKQISNVGFPVIEITSNKLVEPILFVTLHKSAIYPVRMLCSGVQGEPLAELNYKHSKIPLRDTLIITATSGTPKNKLEVLIRYA